ncbi:MAG TPA: hypothetical protein VM784_04155 [Actinomycetota bacterium]|jgi:hypothetical protein|nr:hypothetical protein [Actinomycetota bacterium]
MKRGVVLLCGLLFLFGTVQAGGSWRPVAKGVARGDLAHVSLSGDAPAPTALRLAVDAEPRQLVDVSWRVACFTPDFDYATESRDFEATTPVERNLPVTIDNPEYCTVYASVFNDDGKLMVKVQHR